MNNLLDWLQTVAGLSLMAIGIAGVWHWTPLCIGVRLIEMPLPLSMSFLYVAITQLGYDILIG